MPERVIRISTDTHEAETGLVTLLRGLRSLGGQILSVHPSLATNLDITELPDYLIDRYAFDKYARRLTSSAHVTRSWRYAAYKAPLNDEGNILMPLDNRHVDLEALAGSMCLAEQGHDNDRSLLSGKRWNLFAHVINERLAGADSPLILPWDEKIHPRLVSQREAVRTSAAYDLQAKYLGANLLEEPYLISTS